MEFPADPLDFMDLMVDEHKRRWRSRRFAGEALKYMREAVDVQGLGEEFIRLYVHNPNAVAPDPNDSATDLAMLQLYEHWRLTHAYRPIEPWDGTKLRPWLPPESNPTVPGVLGGDLSDLADAFTRFPGEDGATWKRVDALGNAVESYFREIQRHHVWSRTKIGGRLRLYRLNGLNNIETAPYSILFWGFLKWVDLLRRRLFDLPVEDYPHDDLSDISFMHTFNQHHFPWHDDVFGNGRCERIDDQLGRRQRHKYGMPTQGYAVEFLQFHTDLLNSYNSWRKRMGVPPVKPWRPGRNHSAYILREAFGWHYDRSGTNGQPLDPNVYAPELMDPELSAFNTAAELGSYLERVGVGYHGIGHIENCDIRDVYTNNYSIRFFAWHAWIDELFATIKRQGKPLYDNQLPLDEPIPSFLSRFPSVPAPKGILNGNWTYRSYHNDPDPSADVRWFVASMNLQQSGDRIVGELDSGNPDYRYEISGRLDGSHVVYDTTPDWWEERESIVMKAVGNTAATRGHEYQYVGNVHPAWPEGKDQVLAFAGSMSRVRRPDDPSLEGKVGSFTSILQPDRRLVYFRSGSFEAPEGALSVVAHVWGAGGGGGSDGPGVGGIDGKAGGASAVSRGDETLCLARGGEGGGHGVNQPGKGGAGGDAEGGNSHKGENGRDADDDISGSGGDSFGPGTTGADGVGKNTNGLRGFSPGGGGSGGQMAHTGGGGGGGGGYVEATFDVTPSDILQMRKLFRVPTRTSL